MLSSNSADRKQIPIYSGVLAYFPDAIAAVANVSFVGNKQHNPGEELHWSRGKSNDHEDCIARHLLERGGVDSDGVRHTAKLAWRALALLQLEIEAATEVDVPWCEDRHTIPTPSMPGWRVSEIGKSWDEIKAEREKPNPEIIKKIKKERQKNRQSTAYISGPMRGIDLCNFPAFDASRDRARKLGWNIISPADIDRAHGLDAIEDPEGVNRFVAAWTDDDLRAVVRRDMDALMSLRKGRGDAIIMLPGWEKSTGALAEFMIARWLGLRVLEARTMKPLKSYKVLWSAMRGAVGDYLRSFKCPESV